MGSWKPWEAVGSLGKPWAAVGSRGQPWEAVGGRGQPWEAVGRLAQVNFTVLVVYSYFCCFLTNLFLICPCSALLLPSGHLGLAEAPGRNCMYSHSP